MASYSNRTIANFSAIKRNHNGHYVCDKCVYMTKDIKQFKLHMKMTCKNHKEMLNQKKITRITKNQTEDFNKYIVVPERDFTFDIHDANEFLSQIPVSVYADTDDNTDEFQGEYNDREVEDENVTEPMDIDEDALAYDRSPA
ncbi:hypothetical protein G6F56_013682 [Rhizopus delemar]|nr:hypothetical protein G6F56_013682 [Rhizopus delemar]